MREAELSDGTILEFPDNTPDEVIERTVKQMTAQPQQESSTSPFSGLANFISEGGSVGDVAKSVGNELLAESPVIAGATGGAIIGGGAGGPPGAIAGALLGGTVGAVSKEAVEQGLLATGLLEPGDKLISEQPLEKKSFEPGALDAGMKGVSAGVGEGVGQAVVQPFVKAKSALSASLGKSVTPSGRETIELFKNTDIVPNPAKISDQRVLDILSNVGEAGIFGGDAFLKEEIKAVGLVDNFIDSVISSPNVSREALGALMAEGISGRKGSRVAFNRASELLFNRIRDKVGDAFIDTSQIRSKATSLLDDLRAKGVEPSAIKDIEVLGVTSVGPVGLQQTGLRFSEVQKARTALMEISRRNPEAIGDSTIGSAKFLVEKLTGKLRAASKAGGALDDFERANKFWVRGIDTFNDSVIRNIMRKDPDAAVISLFNAGKDKPVMIRRVRSALKNKELIREFENSTLKTIIFRSTNELGDVVPSKLLNELKRFGGKDGTALKAMFPRGEDKALAKYARIKGALLKGQPDATGRLAVQFGQVRAVQALAGGALLAGDFERAGMFILVAPAVVSRVFRSPSFLRFISGEAKKSASAINPVTFATRMSAILTQEGIEHELVDKRPESPQSPFGRFSEDVQKGDSISKALGKTFGITDRSQ
jgi:hypothetical protein